MTTRVEVGGKLSDRKGVSLPDSTIPFSALAEKDRSDLEAALNAGIDWVALSFIQRPEDIAEAKKITRGRAAVMAKIEKPQAVHRLAEIMDLADALMVARGDLGVEMPLSPATRRARASASATTSTAARPSYAGSSRQSRWMSDRTRACAGARSSRCRSRTPSTTS